MEILTDEMLVELHKNGDKTAFEQLSERYSKLIHSFSRTYYLTGGDVDDMYQEGLMGLDNAIANYNAEKCKFSTFAYMCIKSRMINAVNRASSKKNEALNNSIAITDVLESEHPTVSPESTVITLENMNELVGSIKSLLSQFEIEVFERYFLEGLGYKEIAESLKVEPKKVDNAIQRIKEKVKRNRR